MIYPEIKAPWFHHQEGKDIAKATLEVLKKYGYSSKKDKVYLQCFDADELKRIKNELEPKMGMDLNLVQLIAYTDWNETQQKQADGQWVNYSYDWMFKPGAMAQIAQYADGIGPPPALSLPPPAYGNPDQCRRRIVQSAPWPPA